MYTVKIKPLYMRCTNTDLDQHVADLLMSSLSCYMERRTFALALHLKVWVNSIHWKQRNICIIKIAMKGVKGYMLL